MHQSKLTKFEQDLLLELEACHNALKQAGFAVVSCVAKYGTTGVHFSTRLTVDGKEPSMDHAFADAVRELAVQWSNATHKAQLQWAEKGKKARS